MSSFKYTVTRYTASSMWGYLIYIMQWKKTNQDHKVKDICEQKSPLCILTYRISGIFREILIFAEFATSLKSPKIDTVKNKPYYTSSLRDLEIANIGLRENFTRLPSVIFAKFFQREKFPIYGMCVVWQFQGLQMRWTCATKSLSVSSWENSLSLRTQSQYTLNSILSPCEVLSYFFFCCD